MKPDERYLTKEYASIEVYGRAESNIANLKNLSKSGAMIEWTTKGLELKKGDLIRMTVVLKALNRRHAVSAEVVWATGNRSGLQFIRDEEVIEKIMARY